MQPASEWFRQLSRVATICDSRLQCDPDAIQKVRSLTRCCGALVTEGSVLDGLPIEHEPLTKDDIDAMIAATVRHQGAILAAVSDYRQRTRSRGLTFPEFPPCPIWGDFVRRDNSPSQYAFTMANYLAKAWWTWLKTDVERRRRTARPRTGETPWIMPDELNAAYLATFPAEYAARLHEQPLV